MYETCTEDYLVVNTDNRIEKRTIDHNKRDKNLHILNQFKDRLNASDDFRNKQQKCIQYNIY